MVLLGAACAWADDLDTLQEKAIKAAALKIAPSVVQIETRGGTDMIGTGPRGQMVRKGSGPTTGLIVAEDGFIISSAFNLANKPSTIFVAVPGHTERYLAKIVATDHSRMLTLLKIDASGLPVPTATPKADIKIGQTSLALGRALSTSIDQPPTISVGIISALERIWGKALQTDAKVSPANYGGPLVDLQGRVQGVLVPASPRAEGETAGVEWYDSGIGFAIPLEDVMAVLPRLKEGQDLRRGLLGVTIPDNDDFGVPATVASVSPESAAEQAGIKPGDIIVEINGHSVANRAQLMHQLGSRYEGDPVTVKVKRGNETLTFANLALAGVLTSFRKPFLGILPMRDDAEPGVAVRYVYPDSPAEKAGLKVGDRILKISGPTGAQAPVTGRDQLLGLVAALPPGTEVKLEVKHKEGDKTDTLSVKLIDQPDSVPEKLPEAASFKKALAARKPAGGAPMPEEKKEEKEKPETGLIKRTNAAQDHQYWVYVPENYDPNISHALVIWLHPVGKSKDENVKDFTDTWAQYCQDTHLILVGPKSENDTGWLPSEADFIQETIRKVAEEYTIDRQRVVVHGMGVGGQMAFYLGFHNRDLVRAVAASGAALTNPVKEKIVNQPLSFFVHCGSKDPLSDAIRETAAKLQEQKYPIIYHEGADQGHQYPDPQTLDEMIRWIDSLDAL
jgi:S1-C subfamily serine protease/predicted esterase